MNRHIRLTCLALISLGVILAIYPVQYEINIAPELLTPWEDSKTVAESRIEHRWFEFEFITEEQSTKEGFGHTMNLRNSKQKPMNVTLFIIEKNNSLTLWMSESGHPIQLYLSENVSFNYCLRGQIYTNESVVVNANIEYHKYVEPEIVTEYPYRFGGFVILFIGIMGTNTRQKPD